MQFLFDHLTAVMISGLIILVAVQVQRTSQDTQVETTRYYANRTHLVAFIDMLERDFQNIGSGVDPAQPMILDFSWTDSQKYLEFRATVDTTASAPVEQIKYQLVPTHLVDMGQEGTPEMVQCYELQRLVYDPVALDYQLDGKSAETLTDFEIELRTGAGYPVGANLDETRAILVRVGALSPLGVDRITERTRWQTRFQPVNLTLKDF